MGPAAVRSNSPDAQSATASAFQRRGDRRPATIPRSRRSAAFGRGARVVTLDLDQLVLLGVERRHLASPARPPGVLDEAGARLLPRIRHAIRSKVPRSTSETLIASVSQWWRRSQPCFRASQSVTRWSRMLSSWSENIRARRLCWLQRSGPRPTASSSPSRCNILALRPPEMPSERRGAVGLRPSTHPVSPRQWARTSSGTRSGLRSSRSRRGRRRPSPAQRVCSVASTMVLSSPGPQNRRSRREYADDSSWPRLLPPSRD